MSPEVADRGPIFVVGVPRSGTTLLASMLSAHPSVAIAPETHYFSRCVAAHGEPELSGPGSFERFWRRVTEREEFGHLGVDADAVLARIRSLGEPTYRTVLASMLREYAEKLGRERWGEKTPAHERWVGTLLEWYPRGRVLHIVRDPRAVASSLRRTPWGSRTPPDLHALAWRDAMIRAQGWRDHPRVRFLRYEELVRDPRGVLEGVCDFVGEAFHPDMIQGRSTGSRPVENRTGWDREHLLRALEPVSTDSVDRWRSDLSPSEVAAVEQVVRDAMVRFGYRPETPEPGPLAAGRHALRRTWARAVRWVRDLATGRSRTTRIRPWEPPPT